MKENSVAIFTKASQMLAEADTIQKAKELKDLALTAADWAKRKGMGEEAIRYARSYALEAERKMGQMLAETERAKGAAGIGPIAVTYSDHNTPTLAELGLTKRDSADAQKLAELTQETFDEVKQGKKSLTQVRREQKQTEVKQTEWPTGKYRIIYADPPWSYGNTMPDDFREQRDHYAVMSLDDICELPVKGLTTDDAVLFLWATSPILEECFEVINAWGFKYKASFIWDKVKHNMGHYNSVRHEFLLISVKGSCPPDVQKLFDSVQTIERTEHSSKPSEFRQIINTLYPYGTRIELFAREKHEGWDTYGNEI